MNTEIHTEVVDESPPNKALFGLRVESLAWMLRTLGAGTLIAAVSIFLLQGWDNGNDTYRYMLLLAHTAGLAAIGFASGHWLRETKGARLFLAIALASVPANFAILGGFLYSQWGVEAGNIAYPAFAHWNAESVTAALLTTASGLVVLAPVIWLGFRVLARRSAWSLTWLYLLTNVALLIPVREVAVIGWLLLALTVVVLRQLTQASKTDTALKTPEGFIARGLQLLPLFLLLGRNLWLYAPDVFLVTIMSLMAFMMLRQVSQQLDRNTKLRTLIERFSILPAVITGLSASVLIHDLHYVNFTMLLPVFGFITAALVLEISMRAANSGALYRRLAAVIVSTALFANLMLFGGVVTAALCLASGLFILVYGYMVEQRVVFILGALTLAAGLLHQVVLALQVFDLGSWGSLALLGSGAILIGSAIERYGSQMKARLHAWGGQFRSWEY